MPLQLAITLGVLCSLALLVLVFHWGRWYERKVKGVFVSPNEMLLRYQDHVPVHSYVVMVETWVKARRARSEQDPGL
jgi:hypothetical protein